MTKRSFIRAVAFLLAAIQSTVISFAQAPETVNIDPSLKKSVTRYASSIPSTIQTIDIKEKVQGETLSSDGEYLVIVTKKGLAHVYRTADCQELFSFKMKHNRTFFTADYCVAYSSLGIESYNLKTGKLAWERHANVLMGGISHGYIQYLAEPGTKTYHVVDHNEEAILLIEEGSSRLSSLSISSGDTLWTALLPVGPNNFVSVQDTCLILLRNTNLLLDTQNGSTHKLKAGGKITSQILLHKNRLYAASQDHLYCFDAQSGNANTEYNILWSTSLPNSGTTMSYLYQVGDTLVLINMGGTLNGQKLIPESIPYVATFDPDSGTCYWNKPLSNEAGAFNCTYATDSIIYACSRLSQQLLQVAPSNGDILPMRWDTNRCGTFQILSWGEHYLQDPATLHFKELGFGFECALNSQGDAYRVTAHDAPQLLAQNGEIYSTYKTLHNGVTYIATDANNTWLISPDGKPLYHFNQSLPGSYIEGNTMLIFTKDKHYGVIRFPENIDTSKH